MSDARETVLGKLRRNLKSKTRSAAAHAALEARLGDPRRNLVPARGEGPAGRRVDLFESMAVEQAATVERLESAREVPAAVARYLTSKPAGAPQAGARSGAGGPALGGPAALAVGQRP